MKKFIFLIVAIILAGFSSNLTAQNASLPQIFADQGDAISVPLTINNMVNLEGADIIITFDASVINATGATLTGGILENGNYGFQANTSAPGSITLVLYANAALYSGSGIVAYLQFNVVGNAGSSSSLTFTQFKVNETNYLSSTTNGSVTINGGVNQVPSVDITAPSDGANVSTVSVLVTGTASDTDGSVVLVQTRLNNGSWQNATGTTNWSTNLNLAQGPNTIEAKAQDDSGDWSAIDQITVNYTPPSGVSASLPNVTTYQGSAISVPLTINNMVNLEGADIIITFDASVINATGAILTGGILENGNYGFQTNTSTPGSITLVLYANAALYSGSGIVAYLQFNVVGSAGSLSSLTFTQFKVNEINYLSSTTNGSVTINEPENQVPSVNIIAPSNGANVSNVSVLVTGTASDTDGSVVLVQTRLNNGSWENATGTGNWSINLSLVQGQNTIEAKAQDDSGDWSAIDQITVSYTPLPEIFDVGGGGSYCAGTTPSGVSITLSGSQLGITYQLKKNGSAIGSSVNGTGNTLSWVNQTAGNYTVDANNGYQTVPMSGSAVIIESTLLPVSVNIQPSANTICAGTQVSFTASPVNGGSTPSYQWKVNGSNVGGNSPSYSYVPLNNDVVNVVLTSNESCTSGNPASSNAVNMLVNPLLPVSVNIQPSANNVCAGTQVSFTASPVNGGSTPIYQWKVNGSNVGGNSPSFNYTPANNDLVTVELTSNATCATGNPATSNAVSMLVNPLLPVSVSIQPSANNVCAGTQVSFTASPVNGGSTPIYQWKVNGSNVGGNSPSYSYVPLNNDVVTVVLTSNASCTSGNPASSNAVNMLVNPLLPVSVNIQPSANNICAGTQVNFTATPVNGGSNPIYQWKVNGNNVGGNSPSYSYVPLNNDVVNVVLTSNASCTSGNPASSNAVNMIVNPLPEVSWTNFEPDTLCIFWEPVLLIGGFPLGGTYNGEGVIDGYFIPSEAGVGTHDIIYTYTNDNGCFAEASISLYVDICASQSDIQIDNNLIELYPNPGRSAIKINIKNKEAKIKGYTIVSQKGEIVVISNEIMQDSHLINIEGLGSGVYHLIIQLDKSIITKTFVVVK